ncbi:GDSL-type esterase/lipase family protein [Paenibacillus sp. YYML68]|uniref:GDSL-type esterase/lipase family protein n=1 Tax=Paenibacillus sp. YYML68 TaxID=2909250 RepID=UPI0024937893|nr:GDSL-type esterase/lipase family protein [Paenibacillus sp. YYML68]
MSSTRWLWRTVGVGALASTIICGIGFTYAVNEIIFPASGELQAPSVPAAPANTAEPAPGRAAAPWNAKAEVRLVALGDSLTAGTGDITGKGYVRGVKDKLQETLDKPVFVYNNFAIPGFRTYDLLNNWEAKPDIAKSIAEADVVLLTIGGNDLFEGGEGIFTAPEAGASGSAQGAARAGGEGAAGAPGTQQGVAPGVRSGAGTGGGSAAETPATGQARAGAGSDVALGEGFNPEAAAKRMPEALKRLEQIMERVSKANPNARVLYVGLYHPFLDLDKSKEGSRVIQQWNTAAFDLATRLPNVTVVPTYDLFELYSERLLYTDHFHPNQEGYERIANRIVDILN